jgi:hypothetical protein
MTSVGIQQLGWVVLTAAVSQSAGTGRERLTARASPPLGTAVVSTSDRPATVQIRTFGRAGSLVRAIRIPVLAVAGDSIGGVSEARTRPLPAGDSVGVAA